VGEYREFVRRYKPRDLREMEPVEV
jgi:hypothetical protein